MTNDDIQKALEAFIKEAAGARQVTLTKTELLPGGAIQENWLIAMEIDGGAHAGTLEAVVRTDSPSGVAASHNRAQEFALLQAAFAAGVAVPEPLWLCSDVAVIGRSFFVMRRIGGTAAAHRLVKEAALGGDRVVLAERLGEELARIHSIHPPQPTLDFLPQYDEAPALRRIAGYAAYLDTYPTAQPALEWGLAWLTRHAPPRREGGLVLTHGDFRTGNYMVDGHGLTGILDWEFASWSDPLEDIGWFCAKCWRFGANQREAGGIGNREDFYRGYERVSGRPVEGELVRYWEVMAHMKWAIIALQQAQRHVSGEERSLLLALTGHIVPELEYEILKLTEEI